MKYGGRESTQPAVNPAHTDSRGGGEGGGGRLSRGWEEAGKRDFFPLTVFQL
jgi:hypothetical protein